MQRSVLPALCLFPRLRNTYHPYEGLGYDFDDGGFVLLMWSYSILGVIGFVMPARFRFSVGVFLRTGV